jgi:transposase
MRHIGVDLHKTNFVVCFLHKDETTRLETYPLTKVGIARFTRQLNKEDEVAVEVTQNIYYFHDQIKAHVSRVVLVDTYRFSVISKSKKKTDKADAHALARFLKLGYLPEVPVPSVRFRRLRQLFAARETLGSIRTKLKNMGHAALTRNGIALSRSPFASAASRARPAQRDDLAATDTLIMQATFRQITELNKEVELLRG